MSRESEKFNRAFQQFLNDNPDIDIDVAQKEFINLYNSGQYKMDDAFSKAEEIYVNALELDDPKLVKDALKKALEICPNHFEAKGELLILESKTNDEKISRIKSLLNEMKEYLEKNEEIDFNNFERTLWLNINVRPYLRNMFKLMMLYLNTSAYDDAYNVGKELIRLDPENHQDQTVFYLISLLGNKKYDEAINDSKEFFKLTEHSKFLFIPFLASMYKGDDDTAFEYATKLAKVNCSYLCMMIGIVNLEPEDYHDIFSNPYVEVDSFEDAARVFFSLNQIIYANMRALNRFIDTYGGQLVTLIDPTPKGMELLFMLVNKRESTLKELVQALKLVDSEMDFAKIKNYSEDQIRKELIKLKNKKYLEYHESKYYLTYLGNTVLRFFVGDGEENENN